jgi:hypothetical protein
MRFAMKNKIFFLAVLCTLSMPVLAEEHEHKNVSKIELSNEAIVNYGIQFQQVESIPSITLPKTAIVISKDEYFVYAKKGKHFQEIKIHPTQITDNSISFQNETDAQEFVITSAPYLRIVFLNNKNPSEGHSH